MEALLAARGVCGSRAWLASFVEHLIADTLRRWCDGATCDCLQLMDYGTEQTGPETVRVSASVSMLLQLDGNLTVCAGISMPYHIDVLAMRVEFDLHLDKCDVARVENLRLDPQMHPRFGTGETFVKGADAALLGVLRRVTSRKQWSFRREVDKAAELVHLVKN